jgi:hypothetical protein
MGKFSDIVENSLESEENPNSSEQNKSETVINPQINSEPIINKFENITLTRRSEQASSTEEAIEKNILFSRNLKIEKEEKSKPKKPPKELNYGQPLFRYKLLQKPTATSQFVSNPSIRSTKDPEQPFVPVKYDKPKTLRRTSQSVPVEEVAQDPPQDEQETL